MKNLIKKLENTNIFLGTTLAATSGIAIYKTIQEPTTENYIVSGIMFILSFLPFIPEKNY